MKYLWIVFLALLPHLAMGQCSSSQKRPSWVNGFFDDKNNSYIESVSAIGSTEDEARNKAAQIIMTRRGIGAGQRIRVQNGSFAAIDGSELEVKSRVIDEFREICGHEYRVSLLVQTAKNPTFDFERVEYTDKYPFSARVFVPGWAQLHKGSTTKGIFFIAGEAVLIGGVVIAENLRSSNEAKISSTRDKQTYIDNANMYENVRNGLIAGAAALYVWNVIDGIAARGKKHIRVLGDTDLHIMPYIVPNVGSGLTLSLNF